MFACVIGGCPDSSHQCRTAVNWRACSCRSISLLGMVGHHSGNPREQDDPRDHPPLM